MSDLPEGYRLISEEDQKKAAAFFAKGQTLSGTGQYEYSIEMYMQGLNIDPDAVPAHQALRDISLKRKASGGKAMGMKEKWGLKKGDDKQNMLNAEKMLGYDPGNTDNMVTLLESALKAGFYDTVMWVGAVLLRANADSSKPDFNKYIKLKDAYVKLRRWAEAVAAIKYAQVIRPDDSDLAREGRDLSARDTMSRGGYEKGGSFRDSVKDMAKQRELMVMDTDVRSGDAMMQQIASAEAEWKAEPNEPGKLLKLTELLAKTEVADNENRAIELLEAAYQANKQFRFRDAAHKIVLAQFSHGERAKRADIVANPNDETKRRDYQEFNQKRWERELQIFQEAVENYPTDMSKRYNLGERFFALGRFDEAIPIFQQARNDPKFKVPATIALGRAFLDASFVEEACDTLKELIDGYEIKSDAKFTEMSYWYGRSLEQKGDIPAAIKAYSSVAMANFNYRDVQARIKRLRGGGGTPPAQST